MKYENGKDWVQFKPGAGRLTINQVITASNTASLLAEHIAQCHFENDAGAVDAITSNVDIFEHLTFRQLDWLGKMLIAWARDEVLDPEV